MARHEDKKRRAFAGFFVRARTWSSSSTTSPGLPDMGSKATHGNDVAHRDRFSISLEPGARILGSGRQISPQFQIRNNKQMSSTPKSSYLLRRSCTSKSSNVGQEMEHAILQAALSGKIRDFESMLDAAPILITWLKRSLPLVTEDKELKENVQKLLGLFFFTANLKALGLWEDLQAFCRREALIMGQEMKAFFEEKQLGEVLGKGFELALGLEGGPSGTVKYNKNMKRFLVYPSEEGYETEGQDTVLPAFPHFRNNICDEYAYIHLLRMIAMGIDNRFQAAVQEVCTSCRGSFHPAQIKGYQRMLDKCLSKSDHFYLKYPRPSRNLDINRNCCTFETVEDMLDFCNKMRSHSQFGNQPIRIKNMFLFDDKEAVEHLHYRTVMINWLYTPGITYQELAQESKALWVKYYNFMGVKGYGRKAPSISWCEWRERIEMAMSFLRASKPKHLVQFIVETQLLLKPYLEGRKKMHFLYKITRCAWPLALFNEFRNPPTDQEEHSYDTVEDKALEEVNHTLSHQGAKRVNEALNCSGITLLGKACNYGNYLAVKKLLSIPEIDVNLPIDDGLTPLYLASSAGHSNVVRLLLEHPQIDPNLIADNNSTGATALHAAASKGYLATVQALLSHPQIDVNLEKNDGTVPLYVAAQQGFEDIVAMLIQCKGIDVDRKRKSDGTTPLYSAVCYGHYHVVRMLCARNVGANVTLANFENVTPLGMALYLAGNPQVSAACDEGTSGVSKENDPESLQLKRRLSRGDALVKAQNLFHETSPLQTHSSKLSTGRGSGVFTRKSKSRQSSYRKAGIDNFAAERRAIVKELLHHHPGIRTGKGATSQFCIIS